jgi:probable selenium-dependent hydroxylase accessory protein YqeC
MRTFRFSKGQFLESGDLFQTFGIPAKGGVISVIGSGGKSTLIRKLAKEGADKELKTVITTTTHILPLDNYIEDPEEALLRLESDRIVTIAGRSQTGKLCRPSSDVLEAIYRQADLVLIEADGSKRLPLKYPASFEPVIEPATDLIILVAGLSSYGCRFGDVCFRSDLAEAPLGVSASDPVDSTILADLFVKYPARPGAFTVPVCFLFNQADDATLLDAAARSARYINRYLNSSTDTAFAAASFSIAATTFLPSERVPDGRPRPEK